MALIQPSPLVSEIRGSVGGVTFARNPAGPFARAKVVPVNPNSPLQVERRAFFSTASTDWRDTLSQAQRDTWNVLGTTTLFKNSLGNDFNPSGIQLFIRTSALQQLAGIFVSASAPATAVVGSGTNIFAHTFGVGIEQISSLNVPVPTSTMMLYISAPLSQGISFFKGPFRFVLTLTDVALATPPNLVVANAALIPNARYFLRMRFILGVGSASDDQIHVIDTPAVL